MNSNFDEIMDLKEYIHERYEDLTHYEAFQIAVDMARNLGWEEQHKQLIKKIESLKKELQKQTKTSEKLIDIYSELIGKKS